MTVEQKAGSLVIVLAMVISIAANHKPRPAPQPLAAAAFADPADPPPADPNYWYKKYRLDFFDANDALLHTAFVDGMRIDLELRIQSLYWCGAKGSSATVTIYNQVEDRWESPAGAVLDGPIAYPVEITAHVGSANK